MKGVPNTARMGEQQCPAVRSGVTVSVASPSEPITTFGTMFTPKVRRRCRLVSHIPALRERQFPASDHIRHVASGRVQAPWTFVRFRQVHAAQPASAPSRQSFKRLAIEPGPCDQEAVVDPPARLAEEPRIGTCEQAAASFRFESVRRDGCRVRHAVERSTLRHAPYQAHHALDLCVVRVQDDLVGSVGIVLAGMELPRHAGRGERRREACNAGPVVPRPQAEIQLGLPMRIVPRPARLPHVAVDPAILCLRVVVASQGPENARQAEPEGAGVRRPAKVRLQWLAIGRAVARHIPPRAR